MISSEERKRLQYHSFLECKNLWHGRKFGLEQFLMPGINTANNTIDPRIDQIPTYGKRAEVYFEKAIEESDSYQLVARNIQIQGSKRTLGELDFILKEVDTGQLIHVELVSKFYLYDPSQEDPLDRWVGPNKKDKLSLKITKLKEHQLPILYYNESKLKLNSLGIRSEGLKQKVCFKADLYVPLKNLRYSLINRECIKGYWIKFADFQESEIGESEFFMPDKQDWNIDPSYCEEWNSFDETKLKVEKEIRSRRSPLLWQRITDCEYQRFFVVFW